MLFKILQPLGYRLFSLLRFYLSFLACILLILKSDVAIAQLPFGEVLEVAEIRAANVERYGQLEVAWVKSPVDNKQLFQIAAPVTTEEGGLAVDERVEEIRARLRRAVKRYYDAKNDEARSEDDSQSNQSEDDSQSDQATKKLPVVAISVLNNRPILLVSGEGSRPLRLLTITELDAEYNGEVADELAQEWQGILQTDIERTINLFSPQEISKRVFYVVLVVLVLLLFSIFLFYVRRFSGKRKKSLQVRQKEQYKEVIQSQQESNKDSVAETQEESEILFEEGEFYSLDFDTELQNSKLTHIFNALQKEFTLQRRIDFHTSIQWLTFWLFVIAWYVGAIVITARIPILMRYTGWIFATPFEIVGLWFLVSLSIRISRSFIDRLKRAWQDNQYLTFGEMQRATLRTSTITNAVKGLITFALYSIGFILTLNILRIPTGSILAGSAILGLAISFGSQSLVKDVVNGCLILLEDQFAVGDIISLGHVGGVVENLNLRVTQLRNPEGRLITIPNSTISEVQNLTRLWSRVDFTIEVAYENQPERVLQLLNDLAQTMHEEEEWRNSILEAPQVLGIDHLSHTGMLIRTWIKTAPGQQWVVGREFRFRVRQVFKLEGIQLGMPRRTIYYGESSED